MGCVIGLREGGHGHVSSSLKYRIKLLISQNICTPPTEQDNV